MLNRKQLSDAAASFTTGICVLSYRKTPQQPIHGMTINTFASLSFEPPLISFALENAAAMCDALTNDTQCGISILAADQIPLSNWFANLTGEKPNIEWDESLSVPLLSGAIGWYACRIKQKFDAGDHHLFIAEVEAVNSEEKPPLLYYKRSYRQLQ